jgi:DNA invertase Pin-like site-specific DNA recombinase
MTKAFAYLRVSGKGQLEGDGFPRQTLAVQQYAKVNQIEVVQTFREEGVSGAKDLDHRPALSALIEALHGDGVKTVIVERVDRLARDLMVQESIIADLKRNGYEVISVAEPDLCSDDPSRVLMRQVLGAFSQYEKAMIVSKLRGARQRKKAKAGRCEGRHPFGMHRGELDTLSKMQELRRQGESYEAIARALDEAGMKPRYATVWSAVVVNRILRVSSRKANTLEWGNMKKGEEKRKSIVSGGR